jgi:serine protease Do
MVTFSISSASLQSRFNPAADTALRWTAPPPRRVREQSGGKAIDRKLHRDAQPKGVDLSVNHASTRTPWRVRSLVQVVAIAAVLLLGVIALNWPITFAGANSPPSTAPTSQVTQSSTTTQNDSTTSTANQTSDLSVADVAAKANPAVVAVTNLQPPRNPVTHQAESDQPVPYGVGSGYIIDEAGHVVTNNHVVAGGTAFEVRLYDGTTVSAELVGSDPFQDVAVLKLDLATGQKVPGTVSFGDSSTVRAGDQVVAIGDPFGDNPNTVSQGTVGAVDRSLDARDGYALPNLIQHSAPIYEGNSGGPLLNMAGEVIGMNVAKAVQPTSSLQQNDQGGIGFAIESNAVKDIVDQLIKNGKVARPFLGITSQQSRDGQLVRSVDPSTPAATAGLQAGDVITSVDGQQIDEEHPFLNTLIFGHKPGDKVTLGVDRNGQSISVDVTLGERPAETQ